MLTPADNSAFAVSSVENAHCGGPWAVQLVKAVSCFPSCVARVAPSDAVRATEWMAVMLSNTGTPNGGRKVATDCLSDITASQGWVAHLGQRLPYLKYPLKQI